MKLLPASGHVRMRWKNGGGETAEIAAYPSGADLGRFDWRVSIADMAASGAFSQFAGIDRTLAVLDGDGLELAVSGQEPRCVTKASPPLAFPADAPAP